MKRLKGRFLDVNDYEIPEPLTGNGWVMRVPSERTHSHLYELFGNSLLVTCGVFGSVVNVSLDKAAEQLDGMRF